MFPPQPLSVQKLKFTLAYRLGNLCMHVVAVFPIGEAGYRIQNCVCFGLKSEFHYVVRTILNIIHFGIVGKAP